MPHNMHNLPTELSYSVGYVYSTTMKSHKNTLNADHVERPLRIDKIYQKLLKEGFIGEMKQIKFRLATREEVLRIHTADLWDRVESIACRVFLFCVFEYLIYPCFSDVQGRNY